MNKFIILVLLIMPAVAYAFPSEDEIAVLQHAAAGWTVGERVAFWAEQFVGLPYDPDPLGQYVRRNAIVADDRVDCMYHVFRTVELATGTSPADSADRALNLRFHGRGRLENNRVVNYEDRFRYGEDMIESGKWGREITSELGHTSWVAGKNSRPQALMISRKEIHNILGRLRAGDIVFFIKDPRRRTADEIVGHIGIIKIDDEKPYLVSASGIKNRGGKVKKMLLSDYAAEMPFIGVKITRME